jgi:uroporphyrinogen-III decarboxylase
MMTSRERLSRLFLGKPIDRVPIWLLNPFHKIKWYPDIYNIPSYKPLLNHIEQYCDIFDRRYYSRGFCYSGSSDIVLSRKRIDYGPTVFGIEEVVRYKDIELKKLGMNKNGQRSLSYFVNEIEDLEKILLMPYEPLAPDISPYQREKDELGDRGLMMLDLGDPLEVLYHLMSAENFSIFSITEYESIINFTDVMYERVYNYYKYFLERGIGEVFFIVGAEFAGPPLVSPTKFTEMSMRYVKGLVDLIRSYNKYSIVHYHGNLFNVLDGMKSIDMDGLHTIEAPPIGDCTITQAREVLGQDKILIGNIQYDDLKRKSLDEIRDLVNDVLSQGTTGKFILSPTAGPYENVLDEKTLENYKAMIETCMSFRI